MRGYQLALVAALAPGWLLPRLVGTAAFLVAPSWSGLLALLAWWLLVPALWWGAARLLRDSELLWGLQQFVRWSRPVTLHSLPALALSVCFLVVCLALLALRWFVSVGRLFIQRSLAMPHRLSNWFRAHRSRVAALLAFALMFAAAGILYAGVRTAELGNPVNLPLFVTLAIIEITLAVLLLIEAAGKRRATRA